jgi:hypothetical protein
VGEVDELQDSVDERVAERDERIDRAVRQPDDRDAEELRRLLDQVDEKPGRDEAEQQEPDNACELRPASPGEELVGGPRLRLRALSIAQLSVPFKRAGRANALPAIE